VSNSDDTSPIGEPVGPVGEPGREPGITELRTERTFLRAWRDDDLAPFAQLNADEEVMRWFPSLLTREQSDAMVGRIRSRLSEEGWGLWALEVPGVSPFCGFVGLSRVPFETRFTPAVEIGWRLDRPWWGHGYASEAARACLQYAFGPLGLTEVVSFTTTKNVRSRAVMERLGMWHDREHDFDHPVIPEGSPVRPHVLYRLTRAEYVDQVRARGDPEERS
jgi:RimJ/RimL family protein N-acetyltransferase